MKNAVSTLTKGGAFLCVIFLYGCSDLLYMSPEESVFDAFSIPTSDPLEECKNEDQKGLAQIERCKGAEASDETGQ